MPRVHRVRTRIVLSRPRECLGLLEPKWPLHLGHPLSRLGASNRLPFPIPLPPADQHGLVWKLHIVRVASILRYATRLLASVKDDLSSLLRPGTSYFNASPNKKDAKHRIQAPLVSFTTAWMYFGAGATSSGKVLEHERSMTSPRVALECEASLLAQTMCTTSAPLLHMMCKRRDGTRTASTPRPLSYLSNIARMQPSIPRPSAADKTGSRIADGFRGLRGHMDGASSFEPNRPYAVDGGECDTAASRMSVAPHVNHSRTRSISI